MAPTHMPQGALVKTGKSDNGEMDWEEYADTRVQKKKDGSVHYIYQSADHDVKQHSDMADGTQITYYKVPPRCTSPFGSHCRSVFRTAVVGNSSLTALC